jgi:hypothetical protein
MGLALLGCTRANPAYWTAVHDEDAADSPPQLAPDAAPTAPLPDVALSADLPAPEDAAPPPDLAAADLAAALDLAPDLAPRDLAPDRPPDGGVSATGLVAYWRFDEQGGATVADATGNGNTGTTKGGPLWAAGFPAAKFSNPGALALDGQDDYVEIAGKNIPGNAAPKSLCAWFKAVTLSTTLIRTIVALFNDTTDVGIQLGLDQGRLAAWYYGYPTPLLGATGKVDGNWHHAAYTFDGKTHRLYYDGKLAASADSMPGAGAMNRTRLGTYQAPDEMFAGTIDDVRIYSRALSDAEVMALGSGQ